MARVPRPGTIRKQTIRDMQALGTYKPEYNRLIDIYAGLVHEYLTILQDFQDRGRPYSSETAAGGEKKSPMAATLESLRKDILAYSDRLCLNPKALETVEVEQGSKSKLAKALAEMEK